MALKIHRDHLCIPTRKELLVSVYDNSRKSWASPKIIQLAVDRASENDPVQCCSFSPCGKYFAVCHSKDLIIFNTKDWSSRCSTKTERKGVAITFFPKSNVVTLTEKCGNVKFFNFYENKMEKLDYVIGHNSMLIETLVTDDERFVITCDRDEKIRVTNYPNVYNIKCYCLGHTQFVSSIHVLKSDKDILVSSSGDGTVRFWNLNDGEELFKYENQSVNQSCENSFYIKTISSIIGSECILGALEFKSNNVSMFKVYGSVKNLKVDVFKVVNMNVAPWDIQFWNENLVIFLSDTDAPLKLCCCINEDIKIDHFANLQQSLIQAWDSLVDVNKKRSDDLPLLFQFKKDYNMLEEQRVVKKSKCI